MIREIGYDEVKNNLKTGDFMLFHGVAQVSHLIEIVEWSYWSHIGMVVIPRDIGLTGDEPLIWESTSSGDGIVDVLIGKPKDNGVMLIPLSQRIQVDVTQGYDTHFQVKYLNRELTSLEKNQLKDFIQKAKDWGFPADQDMLKYYLEGKHQNIPAPDGKVFCSQLAAETMMAMGFISTKYVANGYSPSDFNDDNVMPSLKPFFLFDGARLK